jgi:hypothetical protein
MNQLATIAYAPPASPITQKATARFPKPARWRTTPIVARGSFTERRGDEASFDEYEKAGI